MTKEVSFLNENIQEILIEYNLTRGQVNEFEAEFKAYDKRNTGDFFCERKIISFKAHC